MALVLRADEKTVLRIQPVDVGGNPAKLDGAPTWAVEGTNPEVVTLSPSEDGMSCELVTTGTLGTCQVRVTGDADLGSETRSISGLLDVQVEAGEAVNFTINADPAVKR
jgi:hypothetical protein